MGIHASMAFFGRVRALVAEEKAKLQADPPAILYHYTSQDGLLGIIKSSGLFLSDARFVNDTSEITYGRDLLIERFRLFVERGSHSRAAEVWKRFINNEEMRRERPPNWIVPEAFYVASFCREGNLLSQWRAYSGTGGCSIGFDSAAMVRQAIVTGSQVSSSMGPITLQRVLYEPDKQVEFLDQVIARAFTSLDEWQRDSIGPAYLADTFAYSVLQAVVSQIKSPVFSEEQEWRLVAQRREGLQVRSQDGRLVPHLHCGFGAPGADGHNALPISEIFIGPSSQAALCAIATRELLRTNGFSNNDRVAIKDCQIPLRS